MKYGRFQTIGCLLIILGMASSQPLSWCDPDLCPDNTVHIACNNDGVRYFHNSSLNKFKQVFIQ